MGIPTAILAKCACNAQKTRMNKTRIQRAALVAHLGRTASEPSGSMESLKLDRLYVVYPGQETYSPRPGVEVMPLAPARERIASLAGQRVHVTR